MDRALGLAGPGVRVPQEGEVGRGQSWLSSSPASTLAEKALLPGHPQGQGLSHATDAHTSESGFWLCAYMFLIVTFLSRSV